MAAKKFLRLVGGMINEVVATVVSAGAGNDGDLVCLDSTGKLDTSVMPVGIGADVAIIVASEALAAGDYVNIWNSAGAFKARKADASSSAKSAMGFVLSAVSSGGNATVYFESTNTQVTSMTPGDVYLSTTPGVGTATPPTGSGVISQRIGYATSATTVNFNAGLPVLQA